MMRRLGALLLVLHASHGCAAPAQERTEPATGPARTAHSAPVPPPIDARHTLLVLRWQNPEQSGSAGRDLAAQLLAALPGSQDTLSWSAPIELVLAMDPAAGANQFETRTALAFGVHSLAALSDHARRAGARLESATDGARYLVFERTGLVCALPPASSERAARVVCGPSRRDVQSLLRYMTQVLPGELPGAADVRAELRLAPLHALTEPELFGLSEGLVKPLLNLQSRNKRSDRAGAHLSSETSKEISLLIRDVEHARGELRFEPATDTLESTLTLHFRSGNSRLLQSLLAQARHAEAPPTRFWRCPPDSSSALFVRGLEPADFRPHKELVGSLFGEVLSYQGTPPKLKELAAELVYAVPLPKGDLVLCSGAESAPTAPGRSPEAHDLALARQRWGWRIVITGDEPDRYRSYLVKLVEAFQDPVLGPQLRRFIGAQYGETPLSVRARGPAPGAGLPHGTRLVEMTLPARELDPRSGSLVTGRSPGVKLLVAVLPLGRGEGTLIGVGSEERVLATKLRAVAEHAPSRARLDQRADLALLRSKAAIAGGFWNAASLRPAGEPSGPNAATNPLVYTLQVDPAARRVEARLSVPKAAVADLAAFLRTLWRSEKSVGTEPR
jgi:hypothetical protein